MDSLVAVIDTVSGFIWGGTWGKTPDGVPNQVLPVGLLAALLLGVGLFMMIRLHGRPIRRFGPAIAEVWQGRKAQSADGAITPWEALSTALSGQVGTGNLAGVATAIALGGAGAVFWMWVTALLGMALAFSESSLALKYREYDEYGRINGGPMYYIRNGLSHKWTWLAVLFCVGTVFSAMTTGSMIQANAITGAVQETARTELGLDIPNWSIGAVVAGLTFAVIIGGIRSIGSVAGRIVPIMAGLYVVIAIAILIMNAGAVPAAFMNIVKSAFGLEQAAGGAAGYAVMSAVRYGVARGLFSNEAGMGSSPIAHAAAQTQSPAFQGEIAMIGVFIDTIVICTLTALVILTVPGDFMKNNAILAAQTCIDDERADTPQRPDGSGPYDLRELFPAANANDRDQIIAHNGPVARDLLLACSRQGGEVTVADVAAAYPDVFASVSAEQYDQLRALSLDREADPVKRHDAARLLEDIKAQTDAVMGRVRHAYETDATAAVVTTRAFGAAFPGGKWVIPIALFLFAFTSIIGWSYYGEQAVTFLIGEWATHPFRYAWVAVVFAGAMVTNTDALWRLADIANAVMAFPNLIAILALSGVAAALYDRDRPDH